MVLLIRPLKKRFLYHFYGTRQTNRPDKPEWFLTQVLTWIRDHQTFVGEWIQPVYDKCNRNRSAKVRKIKLCFVSRDFHLTPLGGVIVTNLATICVLTCSSFQTN